MYIVCTYLDVIILDYCVYNFTSDGSKYGNNDGSKVYCNDYYKYNYNALMIIGTTTIVSILL
jgi:hypothetical protein